MAYKGKGLSLDLLQIPEHLYSKVTEWHNELVKKEEEEK
jgi:hypothetical protein